MVLDESLVILEEILLEDDELWLQLSLLAVAVVFRLFGQPAWLAAALTFESPLVKQLPNDPRAESSDEGRGEESRDIP